MKKQVFNKIKATPVLEGEDAVRFIKLMDKPLTKKDIEIQEKLKNSRDVKIIY